MMFLKNFSRAAPRALTVHRPLHTSSLHRAYKGSQDRESLDPRPVENTASGRDTDTAAKDEAFDPSKTRPEKHTDETLHASGANQELSKPRGDEKAPKEEGQEIGKGGKSKGHSPEKRGTPGA